MVADEREIAALVQLQNVAIVHAGHVVRVLAHRLAQLLVALLGLLVLCSVGDAHRLRQTLGKERQHHDQNHDRKDGSHDAGEEERTLPNPGEPLNQTGEVRLGIAKEATQTGTNHTNGKGAEKPNFAIPPIVTMILKPKDCMSSEQVSLT